MMVYTGEIPELSNLCRIAQDVKEYPTSISHIINAAKHLGFDNATINFLKLFTDDRDNTFENRSDFYNRAAELAMLIREERITPKETPLNPQS